MRHTTIQTLLRWKICFSIFFHLCTSIHIYIHIHIHIHTHTHTRTHAHTQTHTRRYVDNHRYIHAYTLCAVVLCAVMSVFLHQTPDVPVANFARTRASRDTANFSHTHRHNQFHTSEDRSTTKHIVVNSARALVSRCVALPPEKLTGMCASRPLRQINSVLWLVTALVAPSTGRWVARRQWRGKAGTGEFCARLCRQRQSRARASGTRSRRVICGFLARVAGRFSAARDNFNFSCAA